MKKSGPSRIACPFQRSDCPGDDFEVLATRLRDGPGRIIRCPRCRLIMQDTEWTWEKLSDYYNRDYPRTNSMQKGREETPKERFDERIQTVQDIFQHLRPLLCPDMSVLDVACGAGELLSLIKPLVKHCAGVEINRAFTDFIRDSLGIEAHTGDVTHIDWGDKPFDLILCVGSLDHMPHPLEVLRAIRRLLAPGGSLWLTVGNVNEALNHFLPEPQLAQYRQFFWQKAHFFYYTKETLSRMLEAAGFSAHIICRHQYTLNNFLHWYFTGTPQSSCAEASSETALCSGDDPFAKGMNALFAEMETRFQTLLAETNRGDSLWCHAVPVPSADSQPEVRQAWLETMVCPRCGRGLIFQDGALACPGGDGVYPIVDGIPQLVTEDLLKGERQASNQQYFAEIASTYNDWYTELDERQRQERLEFIRRIHPASSKPVILDLGCGHGRDVAFFYRQNCDVIGLDFSQDLLLLARTKCPALFIRADMRRIPLADAVVDAVFCHSAFYHISLSDMSMALNEVRRVLRAGGLTYFCVLEGKGEMVEAFKQSRVYATRLNQPIFQDLLQKAELTVVEHRSSSWRDDRYLEFWAQKQKK